MSIPPFKAVMCQFLFFFPYLEWSSIRLFLLSYQPMKEYTSDFSQI